MKAAYIDTSWLIQVRFEKPRGAAAKLVEGYDSVFSAELLKAEIFAFGRREGIGEQDLASALRGITWVIPDRSLDEEIQLVARYGYVRGADLWHLACACFLTPERPGFAFLTRDSRQRIIALKLGFDCPSIG